MIKTKRYIQVLFLPFFCWGLVFVVPHGTAADAEGSTAPVGTGPAVGIPDSTLTNRSSILLREHPATPAGDTNARPDSQGLPTATVADPPAAAPSWHGGSDLSAATVSNRLTAAPEPKSQNVTINLINRLVERGVLSAADARELIQQAENDAAEARAQVPHPGTEPATNDTVSVHYIPEIVKAQIRDELKVDLLKQARAEQWAAPNPLPAWWVSHLRVNGDVRVRFEDDLFPKGNDRTGSFPNFNAINTGAPYDTSPTNPDYAPQRNVDQNRDRIRLRARLGAAIDLENGFTAGIRLATGQDDQPVSQNQSLGAANNAQGGDFSQYQIWLDRAFIKYEVGGSPANNLAVSVGRFDNPFFSTSIIWYELLAFDGLAVQGRKEVAEGVTPFFTVGGFPVFNTDFNFSSNRPQKYPSEDKWLYAGQMGVDWKINDDLSFKAAGAFYYFDHVEGKQSDPYVPLTAQDQGNTDDTRPAFAQYGNTYMSLRNISPVAANNYGNIDQWQYYGLATPFRDVAFTGRLDYKHFEPFVVSLTGEFVKNVALDRSHINSVLDGPKGPAVAGESFVGGDTAWIVGVNLGNVVLEKRWDWNISLDYRYVESDAVVDGFCEPDFGGGGTNVKGYEIRAALALAPRFFMQVRWYSSDQVAGPTLRADTFMLDLNAKF